MPTLPYIIVVYVPINISANTIIYLVVDSREEKNSKIKDSKYLVYIRKGILYSSLN